MLFQGPDANHLRLSAPLGGRDFHRVAVEQLAKCRGLKFRPVDERAAVHLVFDRGRPFLGGLFCLESLGLGRVALAANLGLVLKGAAIEDGSQFLFLLMIGNRV